MPEIMPGQVENVAIQRRWAASCYLPIVNVVTCFVTAVRMVDNKFCLFHARQGLVLFALWFLTIFLALFSQVLSLMLWGLVFALYIAGIVFALKGAEVKFPILGQIAMKIPESYIFTTLTGKIPQNHDNSTGLEASPQNNSNNITK